MTCRSPDFGRWVDLTRVWGFILRLLHFAKQQLASDGVRCKNVSMGCTTHAFQINAYFVQAVSTPCCCILFLSCWPEVLTDELMCLFPNYWEGSSVTSYWGQNGNKRHYDHGIMEKTDVKL